MQFIMPLAISGLSRPPISIFFSIPSFNNSAEDSSWGSLNNSHVSFLKKFLRPKETAPALGTWGLCLGRWARDRARHYNHCHPSPRYPLVCNIHFAGLPSLVRCTRDHGKKNGSSPGEAGAVDLRSAGREESDTVLIWPVDGRFPPTLWFRKRLSWYVAATWQGYPRSSAQNPLAVMIPQARQDGSRQVSQRGVFPSLYIDIGRIQNSVCNLPRRQRLRGRPEGIHGAAVGSSLA
jgi:hypothetical protein